MLTVENVSKSFGRTSVIRNVSFTLTPGEIIGLVGPSGAGKSVLLKLIGKVIEPDFGTITHTPQNQDFVQQSVGFLFQEGALFDSLSVIDNVAFPLHSCATKHGKMSYAEVMERAYAILSEVGLSEAYQKMPGQLSGGMRRRVGIARALVSHPDLVLLDDPTGGLDPVAASVIMNLIRSLHETYKPTVLLVSHDLRRLLPNVDRVLALFDGGIVCDESPEELPTRCSSRVLKFLSTRYDFSEPSVGSEQRP